jgi:aspartate aminotransferase-like enzyme
MGFEQECFFKDRLMATGPTPVPEFVQAGMLTSVHYHRGPKFGEILDEVRKLMPPVFGTKQDVLIFAGTGTLAMEGAIANFLNPGDKVVSINAGKFGARWTAQAKIYDCVVDEILVEPGMAVDVNVVRERLQKNPDTKAVLCHASETSTGVRHDVKAIARLAHELTDCLCLCDGVTAVGVFGVPMDAWGIDVLISGSQKGFMLPPGLGFGTASERAWERCQKVKQVRYYMDWRKELKALRENSGAFTSAVTLVGGLREVLRYQHKVGLENLYKRSWKLSNATRAAAEAMGFELFVKNPRMVSAATTSIKAEGSYTKRMRERFGMTVSGGQDELKGKIVRFGHIGFIDGWDVCSQLLACAAVAQEFGKKTNIEAGVSAFFKVATNTSFDDTPEDLR